MGSRQKGSGAWPSSARRSPPGARSGMQTPQFYLLAGRKGSMPAVRPMPGI